MEAGKLDRRITLQEPVSNRNAFGEAVITWQDVATVWAYIKYGSGKEELEEDKRVAEQPVTARIRWRSGVKPAMRFEYNGDVYDIRAVKELGRRAGLDLEADKRD